MVEHTIPPVWRLLWFWVLVFVAVISGWLLVSTLTNISYTTANTPESASYMEQPEELIEPTQHQIEYAQKRAEEICKEEFLSKRELYQQLQLEQHLPKAIEYAINNLAVDWNEMALKRVEDCALNQGKSQQEVSEKIGQYFSEEETQYAIYNTTVNWNLAAKKRAEILSADYCDSKQKIYEMLIAEKGPAFSAEQAQYGVDYAEIDWNENALKHAKQFHLVDRLSKDGIYAKLISQTQEQFTPEEATYATTALEAWIAEGALVEKMDLPDYAYSYQLEDSEYIYYKKLRLNQYSIPQQISIPANNH